MKEFKIVLIIILSIIALGFISVFIYGAVLGNTTTYFFSNSSSVKMVEERKIDMTDVEELQIDYGKNSSDINIYQSDSDELVIKEYMTKNNKHAKVDINSNGTVKITGQRWRNNFFVFGFYDNYIDVYLPKTYNNALTLKTSSGEITVENEWKLTEMNIVTASGEIMVTDNLELKDATFATSSGDIEIAELVAETIKITTASGEIVADALQGNKKLTTSSGDIRILGASGDNSVTTASGEVQLEEVKGLVDITTASGDVTVVGGEGYGTLDTASGTIRFQLDQVIGIINMNSNSGDQSLEIPKKTEFEFKAQTVSGDISTAFDEEISYNERGNGATGTIGENPKNSITMKSTSGEIKLHHTK